MLLERPMITFPPRRWGVWTDGVIYRTERCIEIPLAADVMRPGDPGTILDAGCAMNGTMAPHMQSTITHLTQDLSSEPIYRHPQRHYVAGDLRDLSRFADQSFDRVGCISTLEHVGCDNTVYHGPVEDDPASVSQAVRELWRVTKQRLFLTMPIRPVESPRPGWRYFTPETLQADVLQYLPPGQVVYYRHHLFEPQEDGYWNGPFPAMQTVEHDVGAERVRQIVAILVQR